MTRLICMERMALNRPGRKGGLGKCVTSLKMELGTDLCSIALALFINISRDMHRVVIICSSHLNAVTVPTHRNDSQHTLT